MTVIPCQEVGHPRKTYERGDTGQVAKDFRQISVASYHHGIGHESRTAESH